MPVQRWFVSLVIGLFVSTSVAPAILIATPAGRVGGFLVSDDGAKLTLRILAPEGEEKVKEFTRVNVKILHRLDVKRLEGLSRDNSRAYRDYAEELAVQEA